MAPVHANAPAGRDVLVVEDDPEINRLVGAYVELAGFHCVPALNGAHALTQMRSLSPVAVVLDLMLPDISGWEVCRRLKADQHTHHVPIIILTALDNEESRREGLRLGAVEYLTKPFDPEQLLEILSRFCSECGEQEAPAGIED